MLRRPNCYLILFGGILTILIFTIIKLKNESTKMAFPNFTLPNTNVSALNVETILKKTRDKISSVLSTYNFSFSGVDNLNNLLMEKGGQPIRSIIISSWRSGSTFTGGLLAAAPATFYHFEPLFKFGIIQIRDLSQSNKAVNNIKKFFQCNFHDMEDYFEFAKTDVIQVRSNKRLWDYCKHNKYLCFDEDFNSQFCKLFPFQTMKVCRLRLRYMENILNEKDLNVKAILLVRDPRGIMNSRQHRSFCQYHPDCWQPELLCADMVRDYWAARQLLNTYPNRIMVLRFEDLAQNLYDTSDQILEFVKISAKEAIGEFLSTHTNDEMPGFSSIHRVSRNIPFKWKKEMDFDQINEIQMVCKEAMNLWGYRIANNETHLTSTTFYPIKNYTIG